MSDTTNLIERAGGGVGDQEPGIALRGPLLAAVDVNYGLTGADAACVVFESWNSSIEVARHVASVPDVAPYEPGAFYKRELPCLLAVLARVSTPLTVIVIDGYVWLSSDARMGLGAHLYQALGGKTIVVGVAKTAFAGSGGQEEVFRGESKRPLYVTAEGTTARVAAGWIRGMHGPHRVPTLLKRVDTLCRHPGS